ncbi:MAG: hypothetical protein HZA89_15860 [Verrucomicrobia bacterium]|nr:hypothetical protein [Verrucomicrobiota bacterium]
MILDCNKVLAIIALAGATASFFICWRPSNDDVVIVRPVPVSPAPQQQSVQNELGTKARKLLAVIEELRNAPNAETQERLVEELIDTLKQPQKRSDRVPSIVVVPIEANLTPVNWGSLTEIDKIKAFIVHDAFHTPPMYPELVFVPLSEKVIHLLRKRQFVAPH